MSAVAFSRQQKSIFDAARHDSLTVHALAGTGKTTTVGHLLTRVLPPRSSVYLAFNREAAQDARARFGGEAKCQTSHAYALTATRSRWGSRRPGALHAEHWRSIISAAALDRIEGYLRERRTSIRVVSRTMARFCQSADAEVTRDHVAPPLADELKNPAELGAFADEVARVTADAFHALVDARAPQDLPVPHDVYLKHFQLSGAHIDEDVLALDEAQDSAPVVGAIVRAHHARGGQIVLVGDSNQSIYGWRGAVDALAAFAFLPALPLTGCYRFGPTLAALPNEVLRLLGSPYLLDAKGRPREHDGVQVASVFRTNRQMMREAVRHLAERRRVRCVKKLDEVGRMYLVLADIMNGREPALMSSSFTGKADIVAARGSWERLTHSDDPDVQAAVADLTRDAGEAIELASKLTDFKSVEHGADIELCTAHASKGRQWPVVRLGCDFAGRILQRDGEGRPIGVNHEELRLVYVALTRGMEHVDVPEVVRTAINDARKFAGAA